jgi:hypothetical protein
MLANFKKPADGWLCFLSVLWVVLSPWLVVRFALQGKWAGVLVRSIFGLAAAGLWFQSTIAAWTLIVFASFWVIYTLVHFGTIPPLRVIGRLLFAGWSIYALVEFLKEQKQD